MAEEYSQRSKAWYLLPIFLGIIGGIIGFFVLRRDSPKMARNCLIIGIITLVIGIVLSAAGSLAALNGMTDMVAP
jgi:H+/Cl- antiporter ClcA